MAKNKKKNKIEISDTYDKKTITRVVSIIILIFMIVYMITSLIINNDNSNNIDNEKINIQYEEILAGDLFNQGDKQYYVMLYDFEKSDAKYIDLIINNKLSGEDALPVYKVDLGNGFNKNIIDDKSNNSSDIKNLKVINGSTVIRVHNKKIELFIEDINKIKQYFGY
ncbi:MAG: hypothetical protein WDA21_03605 [Bacilli bacterium]